MCICRARCLTIHIEFRTLVRIDWTQLLRERVCVLYGVDVVIGIGIGVGISRHHRVES